MLLDIVIQLITLSFVITMQMVIIFVMMIVVTPDKTTMTVLVLGLNVQMILVQE
jgi:hypothetical protein